MLKEKEINYDIPDQINVIINNKKVSTSSKHNRNLII